MSSRMHVRDLTCFKMRCLYSFDMTNASKETPNMTEKSKGWTPERRAAARERILKNKPWEKATGPRSLVGKAIASGNSTKHGHYSQSTKAMKKLLDDQKLFLKNYRKFRCHIIENKLRNEIRNKLIRNLKNSIRSESSDFLSPL